MQVIFSMRLATGTGLAGDILYKFPDVIKWPTKFLIKSSQREAWAYLVELSEQFVRFLLVTGKNVCGSLKWEPVLNTLHSKFSNALKKYLSPSCTIGNAVLLSFA